MSGQVDEISKIKKVQDDGGEPSFSDLKLMSLMDTKGAQEESKTPEVAAVVERDNKGPNMEDVEDTKEEEKEEKKDTDDDKQEEEEEEEEESNVVEGEESPTIPKQQHEPEAAPTEVPSEEAEHESLKNDDREKDDHGDEDDAKQSDEGNKPREKVDNKEGTKEKKIEASDESLIIEEDDDESKGDDGSKEEQEEQEEIIECPLIADILVGRGKALKQHPGNQRMVAIIAIHRLRYQDANEEEKKDIIEELTSEVQRGGTRFLKVNDNGTGWMKCTPEEVKAKVLECVLLGKEDDSDPMARAAKAAGSVPGLGNEKSVSALSSPSLSGTAAGGVSSEDLTRLSLVDPTAANALLHSQNLPPGLAAALDPTRSSLLAGTEAAGNPEASLAGLAGLLPGGQASLLAELEERRNAQAVGVPAAAGGRINGPPLRTDVVIGKEALLYSQEGNLHLQSLVQANIGQEIIPTDLKRIKAKAIYERMVVGGARFLMKEADGSGLWYQLSEAEAQNVVYRGLCEEEKRVQTILISSLQASSLGGGLPHGLGGAGCGLSAASLQLGGAGLSQLGQAGSESLLLQNALAGSLGSQGLDSESNSTEPPKRKYKKRLRRIAEERRKAKLSSMKNPTNDHTQGVLRGDQDVSDSGSENSDNEEKKLLLTAPIEIRAFDVILGRGRGSFNHPGNKNLIKIFRESKIPYGNASKNEKIQMARDIVLDIQRKGGRFLKRIDDDNWEIISNKDAYKKVGHGIRDLRDEDAISVSSEKSNSPELKKRKHSDERDTGSNKYARLADERKERSDEIRRIVLGEPAPKKEKVHSSRDDGDFRSKDRARELTKSHLYDGRQPRNGSDLPREGRKDAEEPPPPSFKAYGEGVQPRSIDVVCGRGKAFNRHPANRKMHDAVARLKYQYRDATSQTEKSEIAHTVLRAIQDDGGKFLKFDEAKREWEELSYKNALKKIYHSIRDSLYNDRSSFGQEGETEVDRIVRRPSASSKESNKYRKTYDKLTASDEARERALSNDHLVRSQQESRVASGLVGGNALAQDLRTSHYSMQQPHFVSSYPAHAASQYGTGGDPGPGYGRVGEYAHSGSYHGEPRAVDHVSARGGMHGMGAHQMAGSQNAAARHHYPHPHHYPGMGGRY